MPGLKLIYVSKTTHVASFTKEFNPRLANRSMKTNGRLANYGLTSFVKEATVFMVSWIASSSATSNLCKIYRFISLYSGIS